MDKWVSWFDCCDQVFYFGLCLFSFSFLGSVSIIPFFPPQF